PLPEQAEWSKRRVFGDCEQIAYNAETAEAKRRNAQGILGVLCELPPPLGLVLPELRRGSPTSLRQGYGRPPQRGCRVGDPGRPPKLQRRRKRLRRRRLR